MIRQKQTKVLENFEIHTNFNGLKYIEKVVNTV
jgi:hypothetical protein